MALEITINKAAALTRDVQVEIEVPPAEEGGEATKETVTQTEHVGWDVAASVKGSWGGASSTFFIDLPADATEDDLRAWVRKQYA